MRQTSTISKAQKKYWLKSDLYNSIDVQWLVIEIFKINFSQTYLKSVKKIIFSPLKLDMPKSIPVNQWTICELKIRL